MGNASGSNALNIFKGLTLFKKNEHDSMSSSHGESEFNFNEADPQEMRRIRRVMKSRSRLHKRKERTMLQIIILLTLFVAFWMMMVKV